MGSLACEMLAICQSKVPGIVESRQEALSNALAEQMADFRSEHHRRHDQIAKSGRSFPTFFLTFPV